MATTTETLPAHSDPNYTQYAKPDNWAVQFLIDADIPVTKVNIAIAQAWAASEGTVNSNNPFAISTLFPGASKCLAQCNGSNPVMAYSTMGAGIAATVSFMKKYDPAILQAWQGQAGWYEYSGNGLSGDKAANYSTQIAAMFSTINASGWCKGCQGGRYPEALASLSAATVDNFISGGPSIGAEVGAAASTATNAAASTAGGLLGDIPGLGTIVSDLTSANFWERIGLFTLGLVLAGVGLALFTTDTAKKAGLPA